MTTSSSTDDVIDSYYNVYKTENGKKAPLWVGRRFDWDNDLGADKIKTIGAPTLVIWGKQDTLIPVDAGRLFRAGYQRIRGSIVIPEAGHLPHEEKAEIVNGLISDFVSGRGKIAARVQGEDSCG